MLLVLFLARRLVHLFLGAPPWPVLSVLLAVQLQEGLDHHHPPHHLTHIANQGTQPQRCSCSSHGTVNAEPPSRAEMGQMVSACTSSGSAHGLFRAAKDGNVEEVRRQLRLDPWLHTHHAFSSGETAWHAAAGAGHVGVLAALLECAVEHGHESGGGGRPTSAASHQRRRGNRIQQQEQQQQQEGEGNQRQEERASGNAAPAAQEEDDAGWALNQTNDKGQTPLMFAAFAGHPSAVQWLLDKVCCGCC